MKKRIVMLLAAALAAVCVRADTWKDPATGYTWTYTVSGNTATIYKDFRTAAISPKPTGELTIPTKLGGKQVSSIGDYAFCDCDELKSVTISDGVTSIGDWAFYDCSGLASVEIPASVTSIGHNAFACCSGLSSVYITDLAKWCEISFDDNPLRYAKNFFLNGSLVKGDLTIPSGVTSIGSYAFYGCSKLASVTIPDGVKDIGDFAFAGCVTLQSVTIPNSVTTIGASAFRDCYWISSVTIPDNVTCVGADAFSGCNESIFDTSTIPNIKLVDGWVVGTTKEISGLIVLDGARGIASSAFYGCSKLKSVAIPDSVTGIGVDAFSNCSGLESVYITDIGKWCGISFGGLTANPLYCAKHLYLNGTLVEDLTIPEGVKSIVPYAFSGCSGLKGVTMPGSMTKVGSYAFSGCSGLTSVTIPDSVKSIGASAFSGCSGLTSVTIPDSVTSIGASAFSGCSGLTSVTIPGSVTSIGASAFSGCSGLTSVTIPGSVTSIGSSAFSGCSGIEEITLPFVGSKRGNTGNSSALFGYIFGTSSYAGGTNTRQRYSASGWSTFYIPANLKKVVVTDEKILGYGAFYSCSGLSSVAMSDSVRSIGDNAFYGCSGLTSVPIPDSVTSIGDNAFYGCSGLTSVTIPASVTHIADSAFNVCSKIRNVVVPQYVCNAGMVSISSLFPSAYRSITNVVVVDGVTSIGPFAFANCSGLTSVTIPDSVTSLDSNTFSGCNELLFTTSSIPGVKLVDGWVVGYTDELSGDLDLTGARGIGDNAFYGCDRLAGVTIPSTVTSIGCAAFWGCSGLERVTIPNTVTSIGIYAFHGCSRLTNVTIPDGVMSIGANAFEGCRGLASIVIPNSVTNIGGAAFSDCRLEEITLPFVGACRGNSGTADSLFGYVFGMTAYTAGHATVQLYSILAPESTLNQTCCYYIPLNLRKVVITDETVIGQGAFSRCSFLTSVTMPDSVTRIEPYAFVHCDALHSVTIPSGVTSLGSYAFYSCSGLTNATMPDSVRRIEPYTFCHCSALKSVTIPGVTSIGEYAFHECNGLTSVYITDLAKWCSNSLGRELKSAYNLYLNNEKITDLMIPSTVTSIANGAFLCCSNLRSVTIPDSVKSIGASAFSGCSGLTSVTIPDSVKSIGASAFSGCSGLASVKIPDSVKSIGASVFYGCSGITSMTIPDSVTSIGASAFSGCSGLTDLTIPDSVTSIGPSAFSGCSGLTSLTIPGSVKSIGEGAFSGCSGLNEITLPFVGSRCGNSETSESFFGYIFGPTGYTGGTKTLQHYNLAFTNLSYSCYIPSKLRKVVVTGETLLGPGAFSDCSSLASITLSVSVTNIAISAFLNCPALIDLTQSDCLGFSASVPTGSFYAQIRSVTIVAGTTKIPAGAFWGWSRLMSVSIPDSVTSIGNRAFSGCSGLASVTIPNSVTSIGSSAFSGCSGLEEITLPFIGAKRGNTGTSDSLFGYIFGTPSYSGGTATKQYYSSSGYSTFYIPSKLKKVVVTDETVVGYGAFYNCSRLTSVSIPGSVERIEAKAFAGCSSLTQVTMPSWFEGNLPDDVFEGCPSGMQTEYIVPEYDIFEVSFNANGGSVGETTRSVVSGSTVGTLPTPVRTGYMFAEWWTMANGGTRIYASTIVSSNVTYYAHWAANQYTVTFDANGGIGGTSGKLDYGSAIVAPTVTLDGHVFAGWVPSPLATVPASNVTYTAQWIWEDFDVLFPKSMQVTFGGVQADVALTNFPALVKLSTAIPGFSYADFRQANGADLRFVDADGSLIPHEIDTWDTNGVSTVWVKVPLLAKDTVITAYWGRAGELPAVDPNDVWDDDYVGVWHLGEGALPMKESSETSSDFTSSFGDTIGYGAEGIVGGSVDFPTNGTYNALVAPDHDALDGFTKFTIEAWTFQDEHKANAGILAKRKEWNKEAAYCVYDSGDWVPLKVGTNRNAEAKWSIHQEQQFGMWNYFAFTADMVGTNKNVRVFRNGIKHSWEPNVEFFATMPNCESDLYLGNLGADKKDNSFNGRIDEVRISKCVRSAEWVKATHDTITDDAFATYAVVGYVPPPPVFSKSMNIAFWGVQAGVSLTNFPALVKLSTAIPGFSYADFEQANGADIRFTDGDGNLIPHEIDTWDTNGVSTVWVKVPLLKRDAAITAHYGCTSGVLPAVDAKDVWGDDYVGVWHLGGGSTTMKESTLVTHDLTASGTGMDISAAGIVGGAVDFKEYNKGRKLVAPDHDALDGFSACTLEAWTYQTNQNQNACILSKRAGYNNNVSYQIYDSGYGSPSVVLTMGTNSTSGISTGASLSPTLNQWNHLAYTFSSGTIAAYKNGTAGTTKSFPKSTVLAGAGNLCVGSFDANDTRNFPGRIDEVRISKVARSAEWVKATHDTVTDDSFALCEVDGFEYQRILYVDVAAGVTNELASADVTPYITNIVKRGKGVLVASAIGGFRGVITVNDGIWQGGSSAGGFGGIGTVIDVMDGASLVVVGAGGACPVANSLSGKTVNLYGAKNASAKGKIQVSGNGSATIAVGENVVINLKDADSLIYLDNKKWNAATIASGTVDLGGRTLTVESSWRELKTGLAFVNGGTLNMKTTTLTVNETGMCPSFAGTGVLQCSFMLDLKQKISAPGWTIKESHTLDGNLNRMPTCTDFPGWEGPVEFSGNGMQLAEYAGTSSGVSNTVFNLKGAVSGSGKLAIGPGWVNLHSADNTYSGAVTVKGRSAETNAAPILAGGGGIGLWNGAACFPNASSVTFTNTARLAFMDLTACTVPNVKFIALEGETQSISGGVHTARSTMAGFVKEGAGTLVIDSPVSVTGLGDVKAGTLKIANRCDTTQSGEAMIAPLPVFAKLRFASGATLDLSDNAAMRVGDIEGSPNVVNSGLLEVAGKWRLTGATDVLASDGAIRFESASSFELADASLFASVPESGLVVATSATQIAGVPASATLGFTMELSQDGKSLILKSSAAGGYAAWVAEKGIAGADAAADMVTNGIANVVRYAFDIPPAISEVGTPVIKIVTDANGNPCVQSRDLATGRDDVSLTVLATEDLSSWQGAALVPMEKSATDGLWKPSASKTSGYVFPSKMFFKYKIDLRQ